MMGHNGFGTIIQIGNCLVSEDVIFEYFSCDYEKCKGECCIVGDSGAPLKEDEAEIIEKEYGAFSSLMSEAGRQEAEAKGFFDIDIEGDMVTPTIGGTQECAYSHFDGKGNCLCAIEKCFFAGGCSFHKPISCRLYPIRVTELTGGGLALNLHRWGICSDAFEKGKKDGIRVYQFLEGPIREEFGDEFYEALTAAAAELIH